MATTPTDKLSSDEASDLIRAVLRDGKETIKEMIRLIQEEDGINPEPLYRREVADLRESLTKAGLAVPDLP